MPDGILQRMTWRSWAALGLFLAAYIGLGFWFGGNGNVEGQVYKWGLLSGSFAPLVLIGVYTASGNKWWGNDLGSALIQVELFMAWLVMPLAWVFWVDHGMLRPGWVAWTEVSAPAFVSAAVLRLCFVFSRIHRRGKKSSAVEEKEVS